MATKHQTVTIFESTYTKFCQDLESLLKDANESANEQGLSSDKARAQYIAHYAACNLLTHYRVQKKVV